jgi:hypothetical protein
MISSLYYCGRRCRWRSNPARTVREARNRQPGNATDGIYRRWTAETRRYGALLPPWRAWREKISIIFANKPQVLPGSAVKGGQPVIRPKKIVAVLT